MEKIVIHESEALDGKRRGKLRRQEIEIYYFFCRQGRTARLKPDPSGSQPDRERQNFLHFFYFFISYKQMGEGLSKNTTADYITGNWLEQAGLSAEDKITVKFQQGQFAITNVRIRADSEE